MPRWHNVPPGRHGLLGLTVLYFDSGPRSFRSSSCGAKEPRRSGFRGSRRGRHPFSAIHEMSFYIGKGSIAPFRGVTIATPIVSGRMDAAGVADWTLMRLTSCVGRRSEFGWFQETRLLPAQMVGLRIAAIGYLAASNRGSIDQSTGTVTGFERERGELTHSASTGYGQSGGPILTVSNGSVEVVGIITGQKANPASKSPTDFPSYSAIYANQFPSVGLIMNRPDVRMLIQQDRGTSQNPATPFLDEFK